MANVEHKDLNVMKDRYDKELISINKELHSISASIKIVENKVDGTSNHLGRLVSVLKSLTNTINKTDTRITLLEQKLEQAEHRFEAVDKEIDKLEHRLDANQAFFSIKNWLPQLLIGIVVTALVTLGALYKLTLL